MGWKIYFVIFTLLVVLAYVLIFTASPGVWDVIDVIESTVVLAGLYAYSFKKKIGI